MAMITVNEAARRAGFCEQTIRRAIHRGELPAYRRPGAARGPYRIREHDFETWFAGGLTAREGPMKPSPRGLMSRLRIRD